MTNLKALWHFDVCLTATTLWRPVYDYQSMTIQCNNNSVTYVVLCDNHWVTTTVLQPLSHQCVMTIHFEFDFFLVIAIAIVTGRSRIYGIMFHIYLLVSYLYWAIATVAILSTIIGSCAPCMYTTLTFFRFWVALTVSVKKNQYENLDNMTERSISLIVCTINDKS